VVNEADLKVDVWRSLGPDKSGDWAIRLTHIPSGIEASARGDFAAGDDPKLAIEAARAHLVAELDARLRGT
jgi:protein subunit release factor A